MRIVISIKEKAADFFDYVKDVSHNLRILIWGDPALRTTHIQWQGGKDLVGV